MEDKRSYYYLNRSRKKHTTKFYILSLLKKLSTNYVQKNVPKYNNASDDKPTPDIIFNNEKTQSFSSMIRDKQDKDAHSYDFYSTYFWKS
jgi:hypothetical protein